MKTDRKFCIFDSFLCCLVGALVAYPLMEVEEEKSDEVRINFFE